MEHDVETAACKLRRHGGYLEVEYFRFVTWSPGANRLFIHKVSCWMVH